MEITEIKIKVSNLMKDYVDHGAKVVTPPIIIYGCYVGLVI